MQVVRGLWKYSQCIWLLLMICEGYLNFRPHLNITWALGIPPLLLYVIQLSSKAGLLLWKLLFRAPDVRRYPLPAIEKTKNGLPCSRGGKAGIDNGTAGWPLRLWCKPKSETLNQACSVWDNDAYRKANFKWTIVRFVLTVQINWCRVELYKLRWLVGEEHLAENPHVFAEYKSLLSKFSLLTC